MIKMVLCFVSFVFRSKNVECDIKVVTGGMKCSSFISYFILIFFFFFAQWLVYAVHGFNRSLFFFKMEFRLDNLITMTTARFLHRFFYTGNHFVPNVWSVGISLLRIIVITLKLHCPKRCILSFTQQPKNVSMFKNFYKHTAVLSSPYIYLSLR